MVQAKVPTGIVRNGQSEENIVSSSKGENGNVTSSRETILTIHMIGFGEAARSGAPLLLKSLTVQPSLPPILPQNRNARNEENRVKSEKSRINTSAQE